MSDIASPVQRLGVREQDFEAVMSVAQPIPRLLTFGVFELDTMTGELRKEGRLVHLRPQPVNVLLLLLERAGDLVSRREITEALWPDDVDVDVEQGLNHCMKEIRAVLGDASDSPRFIQTLPRRGYRFLLEVHAKDREKPALLVTNAEGMLSESASPMTRTSTNTNTNTNVDEDPDGDAGSFDPRFE
jgi:DNA-binding winged helix-turn-helix (wHTH) protein